MKNRKIFKRVLAALISSAIVFSATGVTAAAQGLVELQHAIASAIQTQDQSDFQIEDGVLVKYLGDGGDVIVPDGVTKIGDDCFASCNDLPLLYYQMELFQ